MHKSVIDEVAHMGDVRSIIGELPALAIHATGTNTTTADLLRSVAHSSMQLMKFSTLGPEKDNIVIAMTKYIVNLNEETARVNSVYSASHFRWYLDNNAYFLIARDNAARFAYGGTPGGFARKNTSAGKPAVETQAITKIKANWADFTDHQSDSDIRSPKRQSRLDTQSQTDKAKHTQSHQTTLDSLLDIGTNTQDNSQPASKSRTDTRPSITIPPINRNDRTLPRSGSTFKNGDRFSDAKYGIDFALTDDEPLRYDVFNKVIKIGNKPRLIDRDPIKDKDTVSKTQQQYDATRANSKWKDTQVNRDFFTNQAKGQNIIFEKLKEMKKTYGIKHAFNKMITALQAITSQSPVDEFPDPDIRLEENIQTVIKEYDFKHFDVDRVLSRVDDDTLRGFIHNAQTRPAVQEKDFHLCIAMLNIADYIDDMFNGTGKILDPKQFTIPFIIDPFYIKAAHGNSSGRRLDKHKVPVKKGFQAIYIAYYTLKENGKLTELGTPTFKSFLCRYGYVFLPKSGDFVAAALVHEGLFESSLVPSFLHYQLYTSALFRIPQPVLDIWYGLKNHGLGYAGPGYWRSILPRKTGHAAKCVQNVIFLAYRRCLVEVTGIEFNRHISCQLRAKHTLLKEAWFEGERIDNGVANFGGNASTGRPRVFNVHNQESAQMGSGKYGDYYGGKIISNSKKQAWGMAGIRMEYKPPSAGAPPKAQPPVSGMGAHPPPTNFGIAGDEVINNRDGKDPGLKPGAKIPPGFPPVNEQKEDVVHPETTLPAEGSKKAGFNPASLATGAFGPLMNLNDNDDDRENGDSDAERELARVALEGLPDPDEEKPPSDP